MRRHLPGTSCLLVLERWRADKEWASTPSLRYLYGLEMMTCPQISLLSRCLLSRPILIVLFRNILTPMNIRISEERNASVDSDENVKFPGQYTSILNRFAKRERVGLQSPRSLSQVRSGIGPSARNSKLDAPFFGIGKLDYCLHCSLLRCFLASGK